MYKNKYINKNVVAAIVVMAAGLCPTLEPTTGISKEIVT